MKLIFAFGLSFQLPVALTLMGRVGLISADALARNRRYAIVGVFVVAAIITPPDIISQIGLAIPILVLYELSIIAVRIVERRRAEAEAAEEAEDGASPGTELDRELVKRLASLTSDPDRPRLRSLHIAQPR